MNPNPSFFQSPERYLFHVIQYFFVRKDPYKPDCAPDVRYFLLPTTLFPRWLGRRQHREGSSWGEAARKASRARGRRGGCGPGGPNPRPIQTNVVRTHQGRAGTLLTQNISIWVFRAGFFCAFWGKLDFTIKLKTRYFPMKLDFFPMKLDFSAIMRKFYISWQILEENLCGVSLFMPFL